MNPVEELTAPALAQKDLIDRFTIEKAHRHAEWIQAQQDLAAANQAYLRILKLTAPTEATRRAHLDAIAAREDAMTAAHAAEEVVATALAQARARLAEMRAAWPTVLGPFPVPGTDSPDSDD